MLTVDFRLLDPWFVSLHRLEHVLEETEENILRNLLVK